MDPDGREDKYTDNIIQFYIPEGNKNRPGTQLTEVKGIVIHWTEAPKQSPKVTINDWIKRVGYGSAQYVIGTNGDIYQAMSETEVAWHSGENEKHKYFYTDKAKALLKDETEKSVNYFLIGIELEPLSGKGTTPTAGEFSLLTETAAIQLTARLMLKYKLNPDKDLYRHYDLTTKDCPYYYLDDNRWMIFVEKVKAEMEKLGGVGYE